MNGATRQIAHNLSLKAKNFLFLIASFSLLFCATSSNVQAMDFSRLGVPSISNSNWDGTTATTFPTLNKLSSYATGIATNANGNTYLTLNYDATAAVYPSGTAASGIYAFNSSGAEIWQNTNSTITTNVSSYWYGTISASNSVLVYSSGGTILALDANTGAALWNYPTGRVMRLLAADTGFIYVVIDTTSGTGNGTILCLNSSTGKLVWSVVPKGNAGTGYLTWTNIGLSDAGDLILTGRTTNQWVNGGAWAAVPLLALNPNSGSEISRGTSVAVAESIIASPNGFILMGSGYTSRFIESNLTLQWASYISTAPSYVAFGVAGAFISPTVFAVYQSGVYATLDSTTGTTIMRETVAPELDMIASGIPECASPISAVGGGFFMVSGCTQMIGAGGPYVGTVFQIPTTLQPIPSSLIPMFGIPNATLDGFTVQVTNYSPAYTWTVYSGSGSAAFPAAVESISNTGLITVSGISPGSTFTVYAEAYNLLYGGFASSVSGTSITGTALTPTFGIPTPTSDGFTVQISNYDPNYIWAGTDSVSGVVSISSTGLITVTGLNPGTPSTVTVTTSRTGYAQGSATTPSVTTMPVAQATLTIANTTLTGTVGTAISLSTSGGTGAGAVSYATTGTSCTITATNQLNATSATTCVVTATKAASTGYLAATSTTKSFVFSLATQVALLISNSNATTIAKGNTGIILSTTGGTGTGAVSYAVTGIGCMLVGGKLTVASTYLPGSNVSCSVVASKAASGIYASIKSLVKIFTFK